MPGIPHLVRNAFRRKKPIPALRYLRTLSSHTGTISALVFLPDNKRLVSGSHGGTIRVWEVEEGTQLGSVMHHGSGVAAMAMSPDGSLLASGGADGTKAVVPLRKHSSAVRSMAFSADL